VLKWLQNEVEVFMKNRRKSLWKVILIVVLAITVVAAGLFLTQNFWNTKPKDDPIEIPQTEDKIAVFHGAAPNCPERYCVSITVNGDLLFHPALWKNFATGDENEYDFDSLLAPMKQYYEKSDLAICDMETPLAKKGGNYTGYPIFNTPPQLATAAKNAGYDACTTDTNHSVDQGTAGVNRTIDTLESAGLKHTGSYKTEEESEQPLILDAEGGKVAIITGTNS
jgi:poly-gamma-glutamate synthesis protein (capsule biosynthesis protein)